MGVGRGPRAKGRGSRAEGQGRGQGRGAMATVGGSGDRDRKDPAGCFSPTQSLRLSSRANHGDPSNLLLRIAKRPSSSIGRPAALAPTPCDHRRIACFFSTSGHSGVDRAAQHLIPALARRGYGVDLLKVRRHGPELPEIPPGGAGDRPGVPAYLCLPPGHRRYLRRERPAVLLSDKDRVNRTALLARASRGSVACPPGWSSARDDHLHRPGDPGPGGALDPAQLHGPALSVRRPGDRHQRGGRRRHGRLYRAPAQPDPGGALACGAGVALPQALPRPDHPWLGDPERP